MWLPGWVCRWACALYIACSRDVVRCSALYAGSAKEASGHAVSVYGRAPKVASLGSWDIYSLALRGRVMGLQCMLVLFLLFVYLPFISEGFFIGGSFVSEFGVC